MENTTNQMNLKFPWCERCPMKNECADGYLDGMPYTKLSLCVGLCYEYTDGKSYHGAFKDYPVFLQREIDLATTNLLACRESVKNLSFIFLENLPMTRKTKDD